MSFLSTPDIEKSIELFKFLKICLPAIEVGMEDLSSPPEVLPSNVQTILEKVLNISPSQLSESWTTIKMNIWERRNGATMTEPFLAPSEIALYNLHALPLGTAYRHFFPPTRVCLDSGCVNYRPSQDIKTLAEPTTHKATLFTLREGALPVYTTSLYCRGCNRRYHYNFSVRNETNTREYYGGLPQSIQVVKHFFMDVPLLEFFSTAKMYGWLSAMNCARIYNASLGKLNAHIIQNMSAYLRSGSIADSDRQALATELEWQTSMELRDEYALNGFFLYSLLLDKAENSSRLFLSHAETSQKDRLKAALKDRNKTLEGIGQENYPHACDLCFIVFKDDSGRDMKMQAAVSDGTTIGHPCCAVHDCKLPLISHRHRFCTHHEYLNLQCAVIKCEALRAEGYRTCESADHRGLENAYFKRGKAMFQLQARLKKAGITVPGDSVVPSDDIERAIDDDEVVIEAEIQCDGKPEAGNRKLRAYFGRRRTHNEQIIMRPCGVILSRATFFGSEAVSAVNEFAKRTFPSPQSTPEYFIFDNNCKLVAHQRVTHDQHFKDTGKPVDVFHFNTKHKESDTDCQRYCNPAAFSELIKDGIWQFNSSICEQTNVWLGGFQAILRDMEVTRFNFFLDEMIKRRNRHVIKELDARGHHPWSIPIELLFPSSLPASAANVL